MKKISLFHSMPLAAMLLVSTAATGLGATQPEPPGVKYTAAPRVFQTNSNGTIHIAFHDGVLPEDNAGIRVRYDREDRRIPGQPDQYMEQWLNRGFLPVDFSRQGNTLTVALNFDEVEQEAQILVELLDEAGALGSRLAVVPIYVLQPDLFSLRPFKGDFQLHSRRSDGSVQPPEVVKFCRGAGYDFLVIADHYTQKGSLEAIDFLKQLPTDMAAFRAEEVSPYDLGTTTSHIVAFDADSCITDRIKADTDGFNARTAEIAATLPSHYSEAVRNQIAASEVIAEWIHEANGLAIYAHPFWITTGTKFSVSLEAVCELLRRGRFDAVEVFSGSVTKSATLGEAFFQQLRSEGLNPVPVASSDSHRQDNMTGSFQMNYTIFFAEACNAAGVREAIANHRTIAIRHADAFTWEVKECQNQDDFYFHAPRIVGDFRLVKYTEFLLREFFPVHDKLAVQEANTLFREQPLPESAQNLAEWSRSFWADVK